MRFNSGHGLALAGLLGVAFFWATDIRYGLAGAWTQNNVIDQATNLLPGTIVGVGASAAVMLAGVWMIYRRGV